ncbi:MAG: alpha/beta hydrolase [Pseudomonadota bacterium]
MSDSHGPTAHSYFSQRLRLHYVDWGNPGAPPLLLIHGGRDHCRNWDWVARALRGEWHVIAPDLRGHGDSEWVADGNYFMGGYVYDIAQLIHQQNLAPVTIISHSLGGNIALRYAGTFPDSVRKLIAIEGLGPSPEMLKKILGEGDIAERMQKWITDRRAMSGRLPRRYKTIDEAIKRMQEANQHLSPDQARHLTIHGINQNEDGTFSWKFDNYVRSWPPYDMRQEDLHTLWRRISCPLTLVNGKESWASNPAEDGRAAHFKHVDVEVFENAGHWVHHDRLDDFLALARAFIA